MHHYRGFRCVFLFLSLCPFLFSGAVFGAHVPTLDESLSLKSVVAPRISPDGRFIVYSVHETDWKNNEYISQLWLTEVESGHTFQLTRGKNSPGNAQWSPDGRWISFVAARDASAAGTPPMRK